MPIVWLTNLVDQPGAFEDIDPPHLAAYTFFANVKPGSHLIQSRVVGCCHADIDLPAGTLDGYIRSVTLAIHYR